jgi:hypothetical protein
VPSVSASTWDDGDYGSATPPSELLVEISRRVQSRFFTMDVARTKAGEWMVMELGDAQVAGLPERADPEDLFRPLADRLA